MNLDLQQAQQAFIAEARELLQDMEDGLLRLERAPDDHEALPAIFRAAHTIKGSAGLFGLDAIVGFAHVLEDVLDRLRDGQVQPGAALTATLLQSTDHLATLVDAASGKALPAGTGEREATLRAALDGHRGVGPAAPAHASHTASEDDQARTWQIRLRFGENVYRNGMDPLSFLRYLGTLGDILSLETQLDRLPAIDTFDAESCYLGFDILLHSAAGHAAIDGAFDFVRDDCEIDIAPLASQAQPETLIGETLPAPVVEPTSSAESKPRDSQSVRVNAEKLDDLINLVGELVIAGAGAHLLARNSQDTALADATAQVATLVDDILDGALRLRMVPIGDTFSRFRRVVRDVSQELGKDIELVISGAQTELDKSVVEKIGDPLMHLLRNAMDHGIEAPAARIANGKPGKGRLALNAFHDSGSIVLEIRDDGAGLNRERILRKAVERGLVAADAQLSDSEVYNLIFEPGFSTAEAVTNLSGRGVGMDVVKRNILLLRGSVELDSREGDGTCVRIRLPLTLAIIRGFLVGVGSANYVVPLDTVQECIELVRDDPRLSVGRTYLDLRGEVLPLIDLRRHFNHAHTPGRRENVVVVRHGEFKAGLLIDALLGELQTVIKPLGKLFGALRGISGSTILGNGTVALILDVASLLDQIVQLEATRTSAVFNSFARQS